MVRFCCKASPKTLTKALTQYRMRLFRNLGLFALSIACVVSQTFLSVDVQPAQLIEWDQQPNTYYTGQTLNTTWLSSGFTSTDLARITYPGTGGTRTLTTGSGTSIANGFYAVRLSDSSNGVASNVPLTVALSTNTAIQKNSNQTISVVQSKLMNIVPMDGNRTLGGGQNTICDDRNLTVSWRGLGQAQFGVASVQLRRQSGFTGALTLASVSNIPISGNTSITLFCPRSVSPSTSNSYAFEISVQEPGGSAYTGTSPNFNFAVAPSPTPTPSTTPTSSKTPTPTPSSTPSPTSSPSFSSTPTPSITPTQSLTPSTTETARPSIDYAAIARTAAESVDTSTPAIAGALGGIGGVLVLIGAIKWYQNKVMTEKRKKKLAMSARWVKDAHSTYGIKGSANEDLEGPTQPSIVMYTVAGLPNRSTDSKSLHSIKKGFAPKPTGK
jgi:hypothetical protein